MDEKGRRRINVELQGPDVSGFPVAFLNSLFANLNQRRGRASIGMKHVRRSNHPLFRKCTSPYFIGRVDGSFRKSITSETDSPIKYTQMTTGSVSPTCSEDCAEDGRIKAVERGEEKRHLVEENAKGQVRAVDVVISDEGRGVIALKGGGSDGARALPHSTAMYAIAEKSVRLWRFVELDEVKVALEARPHMNSMGRARLFDGRSWWMNE